METLIFIVGIVAVLAVQIFFYFLNKKSVPAESVPAPNDENLIAELRAQNKEKDLKISALNKEKDDALSNLRAEKSAEIEKLRGEKDLEIKNLRDENKEALQKLRDEKSAEIENLRAEKDQKLAELRNDLANANQTLAGTQANLKAQAEKLEAFEKKQRERDEQMATNFANLTSKNSENFQKTNREQVEQLMKPMKDLLDSLKTQYTKNTGQIEEMIKTTGTVGEKAEKLADALRGNAKIQGNWGEMILKRALEIAGLKENENFTLQETCEVEDQDRGFTDVRLYFPDNRVLVIDSKVSLTAYLRYFEAQTDEERELAKKEHVKSVKSHIDELSGKYKKVPNSIDFVAMFVPNESAYSLAIESEPDLWEYALKKNVVLVSVANLLMILKMLESLWRQDSMVKNVDKIKELAEKMLKKLNLAMENFKDALDNAQKSHASLQNSYEQFFSGNGNVTKIAKNLIESGVKKPTKKDKNGKVKKALLVEEIEKAEGEILELGPADDDGNADSAGTDEATGTEEVAGTPDDGNAES